MCYFQVCLRFAHHLELIPVLRMVFFVFVAISTVYRSICICRRFLLPVHPDPNPLFALITALQYAIVFCAMYQSGVAIGTTHLSIGSSSSRIRPSTCSTHLVDVYMFPSHSSPFPSPITLRFLCTIFCLSLPLPELIFKWHFKLETISMWANNKQTTTMSTTTKVKKKKITVCVRVT